MRGIAGYAQQFESLIGKSLEAEKQEKKKKS